MGEAAGTAADIALASGAAPAHIDVAQLRARLAANGAFLG
jgi:hypothetical protein